MTEPPSGTGRVRLSIKPSPLSFGLGRGRPWARVDGEPVTVAYGQNVIDLDAGRHHVEVYQLSATEIANASVEIDVPAGGEVPLWYAAPYHWLSAGRLGSSPQTPSDTWFIVLAAATLVLGTLYTLLR